MQILTHVSERQARLVRWGLLIGWLFLIASLLLPPLALPEGILPACPADSNLDCQLHRQPGNRLFWGTVVPAGLLMIAVVSHELWRRICPLAFVSQLARALGRQRSRPGKKGRPELVMVERDSWLGRHHLALQWSLLIGGLCLRLLAVNGNPLGLAILLLVTLAAALLVGWAWGGKAWCQYVCPMGPVQTVLTGLRGPLGSTAHVDNSSKVTQSMCRTITGEGREQSACVACQAPCIDIDAERSFWQSLRGKPDLSWIWFSYPGLILTFFALMDLTGAGSAMVGHPLGYLRSGAWAFDADQPQRIWQSLWAGLPLPRLVEIPLLLSAAAGLSAVLFSRLEICFQRAYQKQGLGEPRERAQLHTRLIASFLAINTFFWFVDPLQGALGADGGDLLQLLVLLATSIGLFRSWGRDQATYRRESASEGLRRQLRDLPGLEAALDGRALESLSPQEVFTVVKAMPALGRRQGRATYRAVMGEMLSSGRISRASALLELLELRQSLQLEESDHHAVVRELASEQPALLEMDGRQRQISELRREVAIESIRDLLQIAGLEVLEYEGLSPALQERLEDLQAEIGLDDVAWEALLQEFEPQGVVERQRLERQRRDWLVEAALQSRMVELASQDPWLQPLLQALSQRVEPSRADLKERLAAAGMDPLPERVPAEGDLDQLLDLLWHDPDPDTAGWVLMLVRRRTPERLPRYLQDPRAGLADSPFLQSQRRGDQDSPQDRYLAIASSRLFADLLPEGILWVAGQSDMRDYAPNETVIEKGAPSDTLALVLRGALEVITSPDRTVVLGVGETVGEMGVITGRARSATVKAGPEGARLLVLAAESFETLLRRSPSFGRELMAQLAIRLSPALPQPSS